MKLKVILIALVVTAIGCQSQQPVNSYPFYEATIDELPPLEEIRGILIMAYNHPSVPCYMLVIGDIEEIEQIIGYYIIGPTEAMPRIEPDRAWIGRIYGHCVNAGPGEHDHCDDDARITFITRRVAYMVQICEGSSRDGDFVYWPWHRSYDLYKDFNELGLPD